MAQTIKIKRSATSGNKLTGSNSVAGEIGMNTADKSLYIQTGSTNASVVTVYDDSILHLDDTNNRVGIGTTGPDARLHIYHATDDSVLKLQSGDGQARVVFTDSAGTARVGNVGGNLRFDADPSASQSSSNIQFRIDGADVARLTDSGRFGIGTTSPSVKLHMADSGTPVLRIEHTGGTARYVDIYNSSGAMYLRARNDTANGNIVFQGNGGGTNTEYARFQGNGNFGIGTTSPAYPLDVDGSVRATSYRIGSGTVLSGLTTVSVGSSGATGAVSLVTTSGQGLTLSGSKVGIGTTSPTEKLTVVGDISLSHTNGANPSDAGALYFRETGTTWGTNFYGFRIFHDGSNNQLKIQGANLTTTADALIINRDSGIVAFQNTSNSTGTGSGAVRIAGGLGVAYNVHAGGLVRSNSGFYVNTTQIVDSSRNLVNIGTITSGNITANISSGGQGYILQSNSTEIGKFARTTVGSTVVPSLDGAAGRDIHIAGAVNTNVILANAGGKVGIGSTAPQSKLEVNLHSGASSSLMDANTVNDVQLIRAGYSSSAATTSNAGAKWGLRFVGRNDSNYDNQKSAAIYAVSEDSGAGYNRNVGLAFHTSGFDSNHAERMRITNTGRVGIGTSSPENLLHLASSSDYEVVFDRVGQEKFRLRHGTSGLYLTGPNTSNLAFGVDQNHDVRMFNTSGSAYAVFDGSTSRVAVGTTTPGRTFHVVSSDYSVARLERTGAGGGVALEFRNGDGNIWQVSNDGDEVLRFYYGANNRFQVTSTGAATFNNAFTFPTTDGSANQVLKTDGSGNVTWATEAATSASTSMSDADGDTKIQVEESADDDTIRFDTAGSQRMVIDATGKIGINSSTLTKTVNIGGTLSVTGETFFSHFDNTTSASRMRDNLRLNFGTARTFAILGNSTNMHIRNSSTDVMTFDTSNRVGIGTTSPAYKFDVNAGSAIAARFKGGDSNGITSIFTRASEQGLKTWSGNSYYSGLVAGAHFQIFTNNSPVTPRVTVLDTGNVGIGTTSPSQKLTVRGATEFSVGDVSTKHATEFNWVKSNTGSSGDGIWYKVADISLPAAAYSAMSFEAYYETGLNNFGSHNYLDVREVFVSIVRNSTATTNDSPDSATLRGRTSDIRVYKTATGTYELQARHNSENAKYAVRVRVFQTNGGTITPAMGGSIAGTTSGGTEYTVATPGTTEGVRRYLADIDSSRIHLGNVDLFPSGNTNYIHVAGSGIIPQTTTSSNNASLGTSTYLWNGVFSRRLTVEDGTAGAPAITFLNDTNTGIYRESSDQLRIVTNGAWRAYFESSGIHSSGNVYTASDGDFRNYGGEWHATTGTSGNGFKFTNSADSVDALTITSAGNGTFAGSLTVNGYLRGPATFTIDPAAHGDNTGTVVIAGNLQVDGTTTTINSTTLTVDDKNITLASGAVNAAAANGAGITVDTAGAQLTYDSTQDRWNMNKGLELIGTPLVVGTGSTDVGRVENSSGVFSLTAYTGRQIAFGNDTNGEHVRIDADGQVGIGTSTPSRQLDISAPGNDGIRIASANALIGGGASGGDAQLLYWNGSNVYYGRGTLGGTVSQHEFRTGGTTRLTITSSGNVGIGTTSPASKLDVIGDGKFRGTADATPVLKLGQHDNSATTPLVTVYTDDAGGTRPLGGDALEFNMSRYGQVIGATRGSAAGGSVRSWKFTTSTNSNERGVDLILYSQADSSATGSTTTAGNVQLSATSNRNSYINTSGNFGLGTSAPSRKFEVHENNTYLTIGEKTGYTPGTYGPILETNSGSMVLPNTVYLANSNAYILRTGTSARLHGDGGVQFSYYNTTTQEGMRLDNSGRLLINTTSSIDNTAKLQIVGDSGSYARITMQDVDGTNQRTYFDHSAGLTSIITQNGTSNGAFGVRGWNGTATTDFVRVASNGNVGIGTSSPQDLLHLSASSPVLRMTNTSDSGKSTIEFWDNQSGTSQAGEVFFEDAGNVFGIQGNANGIIFRTSNTFPGAERMRLNNNGHLGIGTAAPVEPLSIGSSRDINFHVGGHKLITFGWAPGNSNNATVAGKPAEIRYEPSGGKLRFAVDSTSRSVGDTVALTTILTLQDGKAGIGVDPSAKLQVEELGIDTTTTTTSATTQVAIDTMAAATFRSARYTIQITNSTDSTYHITEVLLIHDGTTPAITEYGTVFTGSAAEATIDADISSGNVRLLATPASTDSMTFKVVRHCITV